MQLGLCIIISQEKKISKVLSTVTLYVINVIVCACSKCTTVHSKCATVMTVVYVHIYTHTEKQNALLIVRSKGTASVHNQYTQPVPLLRTISSAFYEPVPVLCTISSEPVPLLCTANLCTISSAQIKNIKKGVCMQ